MLAKTVVYTGNRPNYNYYGEINKTFYKDVPTTIPILVWDKIKNESFEEYNPKKHKPIQNIKPILVILPSFPLRDLIACVKVVERIRENNPHTPLVIRCPLQYYDLYAHIENFTMVETYEVNPGYYQKEIRCIMPKPSNSVEISSLVTRTLEFNLLEYVSTFQGEYVLRQDRPNMPSVSKIQRTPKTVLIIDAGKTKWNGLGEYLKKKNFDVPVKYIDSDNFGDVYGLLKDSLLTVTTGDSDVALLSAYMGSPVFMFTPNTENNLSYQLELFKNVMPDKIYQAIIDRNITLERVFEKLKNIVNFVCKGVSIPKETYREPVGLPMTPRTVDEIKPRESKKHDKRRQEVYSD